MFRIQRLHGWWLALFVVASVAFVFHPIVISGYSLSQNPYVFDWERSYVAALELPVDDPAAGGLQDEPWLHTLRYNLSRGKLPLVNMLNGLGAPLLESLQPGVLYVLNPLLVALPAHSSRLFDAFSLLHVGILVLGLYLLLRQYARAEVAFCVALLVGFSGVTYQHVNMVHFRGFVWLPLMLAAGIRLARGERSWRNFALLAFSSVASATAGNLQDFFLSVATFGVVCAAEVLTSAAPGKEKVRRLGAVLVCFGCLGAVAAPAYLPYLVSLKDGNLASVGSGARCLWGTPSFTMNTWLMPAVNGRHWAQPLIEGFQTTDHQPAFPTAGFMLLVLGVVLLVRHWRELPLARRRMLVVLSTFFAVCLAKIVHPRIFDVCASLPLISGLRFTKYVLHNHVTAALIAALSLESLLSLEVARRRRTWLITGAVTVVLLGGFALLLGRLPQWHGPDAGNPVGRGILVAWGASLALAAVMWASLWRRSRVPWEALVLAILLQAVLVRPNGYRGVHPEPRLPHPALAEAENVRGKRLLTSVVANSNLLWRFEDVGVFDPIHSRALSEFVQRYFTVFNPGFHIQVSGTPLALSQQQLDALRFMGVQGIQPDLLQPGSGLPVGAGIVPLEGALPRAFVLSEAAAAEAEAHCAANNLSAALAGIHRAQEGREPLTAEVRTNGLRVSGPGLPERHVLVVAQAYTTSWSYQGQRGQKFCGLYPSWTVEGGAESVRVLRYWPRGLTPGLGLSAFALVALVGWILFLRRGSGSASSGERRDAPVEVHQEAA